MNIKPNPISTFCLLFLINTAQAQDNSLPKIKSIISNFNIYSSSAKKDSYIFDTKKSFKNVQSELLDKLGEQWYVDEIDSSKLSKTSIRHIRFKTTKHPKHSIWLSFKTYHAQSHSSLCNIYVQ